jgi:hypothetical protein
MLGGSRQNSSPSQPVLSAWALAALATLGVERQVTGHTAPGRFRVHITHDVDRVHALEPVGVLGRAVRALRATVRLDRAGVLRELRFLRNGLALARTYRSVMRLEAACKVNATYFFMSGPYSVARHGSRVGRGARLRRLVRLALRYGHRVGLHASYDAFQRGTVGNERVMLARACGERIERQRSHYLQWDHGSAVTALRAGGIRIDSTLGYRGRNGFRTGLAWSYPLPDSLRAEGPAIIEIPLVYMDAARGVSAPDAWQELAAVLDATRSVSGEVAILFHIDYFLEDPSLMGRFRTLLQHLRTNGAVLDGECPAEALVSP